MSLREGKSQAKTEVIESKVRIAPAPIRRATAFPIVVPRTATPYMTNPIARWPYNVVTVNVAIVFDVLWFVDITIVPSVFTPFRDIATHIL